MAIDTAIPGKKPERTNSRKRVRRTAQSVFAPAGEPRRQQINAYYDLKKNSPALKAARITRMKRLNAARWAAAQAQIPVQWRAIMVIFRVIIMSLVLFVMFRVMLAEKQILQIRNALTMQGGNLHSTKLSWRSFRKAYETKVRRPPPEGFQAWLEYADKQECELFRMYNAIERDLAPFRHKLKGPEAEPDDVNRKSRKNRIGNNNNNNNPQAQEEEKQPATLYKWNELEHIATNYTAGAYLLVEIKDNKFKIVEKDLTDWFAQHPSNLHDGKGIRAWWEQHKLLWNVKWLLDPVINHKPPLKTRFVINLHPDPKLPLDAAVPIFSSHHEHYHTDNDPMHPGNLSLEIANKNRNGLVDPRTKTTKDLLLPHLYVAGGRMGAAGLTSSPAIGGFWFWPFFRNGKAWTKRKTAIAWRGATLGTYRINGTNTAAEDGVGDISHNFFTGPRFELMRKWSGKEVHPMSASVPVDVDFAFTRTVILGDESINATQKAAIATKLKNDYRFAKTLSFRRLQQYKYLMDVDSNGMSNHSMIMLHL